MTALGDRQRKAAGLAPSRFAAAIAGKRASYDVTVLGVAAVMTLVGHATVQEIEGAVYKRMAELGIEPGPLTAMTFESERAVRTLAEAVRVPPAEDPATPPLGTLAEWQLVDLDTVQLLWLRYLDLREAQDPIASPLTEEELRAVQLGIEKKSAALLRHCGARVLSSWLLTTAAPPASSTSPSSTSSVSSTET